MTTLLNNEEVDFLRSIKRTAIILLAMGLIDRHYPGRAVKVEEMAGLLELDPRTIGNYMAGLAARGRLLYNGIGYVLTDGGRALILGSYVEDEAHDLARSPEQTQAQDQALKKSPYLPTLAPPDQEPSTHIVCALEVEESLNLKNLDSSSTSLSAQNVQFTAAQVLGATPIVFGDPGVLTAGLDLEAIEPRIALGWVAQAFEQRQAPRNPRGLRSPAGLVHSRLSDPGRPRPQSEYSDHPEEFLPEEYLEKLGFVTQTQEEEMESNLNEPHAEEVEAVGVIHPQEEAWQRVLQLLKTEMSKAAYQSVKETHVLSFEDDVLTIKARSMAERAWLESRLTSTIQRMLIGILNADVKVRFVVADSD